VVEKPLHFVGNGYFYPAGATVINGTFILRKAASGSTVTGIQFNNNVFLDSVSNVIMSRCKTSIEAGNGLYLCGTGTSNKITECQIHSTTGSPNITTPSNPNDYNTYSSYTNTIISKNIFTGTFSCHKNLFIYNNVWVNNTVVFSITNCYNLTVQNNTFAPSSALSSVTYSTIKNNISINTISQDPTSTYMDNKVEATGSTFVNYNDSGTGNYHLKPTSVGVNAGSDGTDIGIYGTTEPFKENRTTAYPQIPYANVGSETNAQGKLKVDITIEAQDR